MASYIGAMPHADFVHLRVHSAYSLSEGAIKADKIATLARDAGMPAVAITDSANMFGALEFSQACTAKGRAADHRLPDRARAARKAGGGRPTRSCLLAQDATGLANLQRLSSLGFAESDPSDPQLPLRTVLEHAAGLMLLTGGTRGPLARLLAEARQPDAAGAAAGRVARGVRRPGGGGAAPPRPEVGAGDRAGADRAGGWRSGCRWWRPTSASSPSPASMHEAHDALLCIAGRVHHGDAGAAPGDGRALVQAAAAMRALFADLPEACDNTLAIARAAP